MAGGPSSGRSMVTALRTPGSPLPLSARPLPPVAPESRLKRASGCASTRPAPLAAPLCAPSPGACPIPSAPSAQVPPLADVKGLFCLAIGCKLQGRHCPSPKPLPALPQSACQHPPPHFPIGSPNSANHWADAPARPEGKLPDNWLREKLGEETPFPHPFNVLSNGKSTSGLFFFFLLNQRVWGGKWR